MNKIEVVAICIFGTVFSTVVAVTLWILVKTQSVGEG